MADVIASATVNNGNTILHLGAQDDITLLGNLTHNNGRALLAGCEVESPSMAKFSV